LAPPAWTKGRGWNRARSLRRCDDSTPASALLVTCSTNGPGWEDPGAVHGKAGTPSVAYHRPGAFAGSPPTAPAPLALLCRSIVRCLTGTPGLAIGP
jgi:hypothetical protein